MRGKLVLPRDYRRTVFWLESQAFRLCLESLEFDYLSRLYLETWYRTKEQLPFLAFRDILTYTSLVDPIGERAARRIRYRSYLLSTNRKDIYEIEDNRNGAMRVSRSNDRAIAIRLLINPVFYFVEWRVESSTSSTTSDSSKKLFEDSFARVLPSTQTLLTMLLTLWIAASNVRIYNTRMIVSFGLCTVGISKLFNESISIYIVYIDARE